MKISERTIDVMKNFASINNGMVLKPGNLQKTISPDSAIYVEAKLEEDFPIEFGIYDLPIFLTNVSLLKNPELDFSETSAVHIKDDDGFDLLFRGCPSDIVPSPDSNVDLSIDKPDASLHLTQSQLSKLLRIADINTFNHFILIGKNGKMSIKVLDKENDTTNAGTMTIGDYTGDDFKIVFKTEFLKMLPNDYNVSIKLDGYAMFESKDGSLKYYVLLESGDE